MKHLLLISPIKNNFLLKVLIINDLLLKLNVINLMSIYLLHEILKLLLPLLLPLSLNLIFIIYLFILPHQLLLHQQFS